MTKPVQFHGCVTRIAYYSYRLYTRHAF
jgi:hypothetical protein